MAQRRHKGHCLPVAVRNLGFEPLAARRPTPQRRHIGLGPGLIDEDQALGRDPGLIFFPLLAPAGDVRAVLLAGKHGFLKLSCSAWTKFHTVLSSTLRPRLASSATSPRRV